MLIKWFDKITRVQVLQIVGSYGVRIRPVEAIIRERRLRWLGHIERAGPGHLIYILLHSQMNNGSRARGKQQHAYRHAVVEDMKKADIDPKTWQALALDRKQWRLAITQGVQTITTNWESRQAAERATRHANNDRNAIQRPVLEPAPQRTSRADKLMQRLRVDEWNISERQGDVDMPATCISSLTAWMRQQLLLNADSTENEIRAARRAFNSPPPLSPTAAPQYPGWTRLYLGWTHYDVAQEHHVWHMLY